MLKKPDFISLIHKEQVGALSVSEANLLQNWKEDNAKNHAIYIDIVEIWQLSSNYTPNLKINVSKAIEDQISKIREESKVEVVSSTKVVSLRPVQWAMMVAAALVFVLSSTFVFQSMNEGDSYSSGDAIMFVQLSDGSNIWLEKNSTLKIDNSFGGDQRQVELQGKAFFDIFRDEARPFIIDAHHVDVKVLGTKFTIDAFDDTPVVAVKSGKVEVKADEETKIITKGYQLELTSTGNLSESLIDIEVAFDWPNGDLSFKNVSLTRVFADLGNYFNVKFNYKGGVNLNECPFTSKSLLDTSLEEVLDILALTYEMKIDNNSESEIKLSRIKCRK